MSRRRMSHIIVIALIFSLFLSACKDKEDLLETRKPGTTENELKENAFLVDSLALARFDSASVTILKSRASMTYNVGDVLLIPPLANDPFGAIRRIVSISESAGEAKYVTAHAGLHEAFKNLVIVDTINSDFYFSQGGRRKANQGGELSLDISQEIHPGVVLAGVLKVNMPSRRFEYVLHDNASMFSVPEKVHIQADFNTEGTSIELRNSEDKTIVITKKIPIYTFKLPDVRIVIPIPTPVGIFPFPMIFGQAIEIDMLPIELKGRISLEIPYVVHTTLGAVYENGSWNDISSIRFDKPSNLNLCNRSFSGNVEVEANYFNINYVVSPYKLKAFEAKLGFYKKISFNLDSEQLRYTLTYSSGVRGSIESKFYLSEQRSFEVGGEHTLRENKVQGELKSLQTPSIITPIEGDQLLSWPSQYIYQMVSWDPVDGADSYFVQVQAKHSVTGWFNARELVGEVFSGEPISGETVDTSYPVHINFWDFEPGLPWRVRVVARQEDCTISDSTSWRHFFAIQKQ